MSQRPPRSDALTKPDVVGRIEIHGVNFIPEEHRHSRPANVAWIMLGSCVTFPIIVLGWVPVALGLSWWESFWAVLIGSIVGALLLAPMSLLSPKTGTNNPVGSSAHYGIIGRLVGSTLAILISILFTALAIWTGGDAMSASLSRLIGIEDNTASRLIWYTILAIAVVLVAVYGHATMLFLQKITGVVGVVAMLIGIVAVWSGFDPGYAGGEYALGSFWPTWFAGAVPIALAVMGYSLAIGDWTRYISPHKYTPHQVAMATIIGGVFGMGGPAMWGTFTAVTFADPTQEYVGTLVATVPLWYVVGVLLLGLGSGAAQGTVNMYSTGLDLSSIIPRVRRVPATIMVGVAGYILVVAGVLVGNLIDNLTTLLDLLAVGFACFAVITAIGYWNHRGQYDSYALQAFSRGEKGGRYWFTNGWNFRAVTAFVVGTIAGLAALRTAWYTGPLVQLFGGIGLGFVISASVGAVLYVALLWLFPEDGSNYVAGSPRIARRSRRSPAMPTPPHNVTSPPPASG